MTSAWSSRAAQKRTIVAPMWERGLLSASDTERKAVPRTGAVARRTVLGWTLTVALASVARGQVSRQRLVGAIIGARSPDDPNAPLWVGAISEGLAAEGWREGDSVRLEPRFAVADPGRARALAIELIALGPDALVGGTSDNAVALHSLTQEIPLVFASVNDPIGAGLVASFNRPGGNATGVANIELTATGKFLSILLEMAPNLRRVGFVYSPRYTANFETQRQYFAAAALAARVEPVDVLVQEAGDIDAAIDSFASTPNSGLVISIGSWLLIQRTALIAAVNRSRLPTVWSSVAYATDGGLVAYAPDTTAAFQVVGTYVGRILNGERPQDLPVQGANYRLIVNLKAAAAQGITIPVSIQAAADTFIE